MKNATLATFDTYVSSTAGSSSTFNEPNLTSKDDMAAEELVGNTTGSSWLRRRPLMVFDSAVVAGALTAALSSCFSKVSASTCSLWSDDSSCSSALVVEVVEVAAGTVESATGVDS